MKTLTAVAVSPSTASIAAGATQQFAATGTYSDGSTANVTASVTWTSSKTAAATISAAGLATGVAAGSTTVTATSGSISGTATLTVTTPVKTLTSIAVTPPTPSIAVASTQQFTATGTYSDGSTATLTTATWTSSNTAIATISSPAGLATAVAPGSTTITASFSGVSGNTTLTVAAAGAVTSIAVTPQNASFAMGGTQQFIATATYGNGTTGVVTSTATWTVANTDVATINTAGLATGVASGSSTVTASVGTVSGSAPFTVTVPVTAAVNISTWQVDNNRSGLNASEQSLTPENVTPQTFGKLFSVEVQGYAYAEPLVVSNVTINSVVHNVLYVATEQDNVYAFDADNGTPLWNVSVLQTGEAPVSVADDDILPYDGITSTPVIDTTSNTIYVVSKQVKAGSPATFRLSALDITTGAQKTSSPVTVTASVPGTNDSNVNGIVSLTTACIQRSALLLANGNVYMGFGNCSTGWFLAYDATTLAQVGVFNASPDLSGNSSYEYDSAGGIWMGSGGPIADANGNVYVVTGNGPWNVTGNAPWTGGGQLSWGDSVLKFDPQLRAVQDYFTPQDYQYMDCRDADLNSGGALLIPGTTQLLTGGKTGRLYLVNTTNLGKEQAGDVGATQTFWFESDLLTPYNQTCATFSTDINSYATYGTAAYFNGSVYLGVTPTAPAAPAGVRQFTYSTTPTPMLTAGAYPRDYSLPSVQENSYGTTPFISANNTTNGIMWMIDKGLPLQGGASTVATSATLRAYDATNLSTELYNSATIPGDTPGYGIKFTSPIVANGKVYISTAHDQYTVTNPQGEIDVYGLK